MKKKIFSLLSLACIMLSANAQQKERNPKVKVADIPGFITLKGDFHLHTSYSDGHVMPYVRVMEAERDGLDVITLTEHIEAQKYFGLVSPDKEFSFKKANEAAANTHVLIIKGAEISPYVAPYHNNAFFLKDVNALKAPYNIGSNGKLVMKPKATEAELLTPFLEVQKQGGWVSYNHPGWLEKNGPRDLFLPIHQKLLDRGILRGAELVNNQRYNVHAHRIAIKHNLILLSGTDAHSSIQPPSADYHRPITLIFAKEKVRLQYERHWKPGERLCIPKMLFLPGSGKVKHCFKHLSLLKPKKVCRECKPGSADYRK
ncbi:PHP domain-containing protein [Niabella ginsengisoli]|uniref:PHP domain-containing protein n=1 Tax=Niabella ginsengisoli TaxID=522298 RepID=A0ABS9SJ34_9BACT|nr:PHP domain-containing protein [Niabella ginsengisoli]MCH5598381.1 PHP domain-containing protein [Niabella ginsengisoli]